MADCHTLACRVNVIQAVPRGGSWQGGLSRFKQLTLRRIISLDLDQGCPTGSLIFCAMIDDEPRQPKKETKPPRLEEIWQNLEDYANDLRAFIERLRKKLNWAKLPIWILQLLARMRIKKGVVFPLRPLIVGKILSRLVLALFGSSRRAVKVTRLIQLGHRLLAAWVARRNTSRHFAALRNLVAAGA
jgi:hypothetical protein